MKARSVDHKPVNWTRAGLSFGAGLLLLLFCAFMAGGGHGSYLPPKILFPYTMLLTAWSDDSITPIGMVVAALQMPVYSLLADLGRARGTARTWLIGLGLVHVVVFVGTLAFIRSFPEWPQ